MSQGFTLSVVTVIIMAPYVNATSSLCDGDRGASVKYQRPIKRAFKVNIPTSLNVPLLRALWSLLDGIWGSLKGSWGVLVRR